MDRGMVVALFGFGPNDVRVVFGRVVGARGVRGFWVKGRFAASRGALLVPAHIEFDGVRGLERYLAVSYALRFHFLRPLNLLPTVLRKL
jgi:hypothetical protein